MTTLTVSLELAVDDRETYGAVLDLINDRFAGQLLGFSIDFDTPSSASSPLVSITFTNTPENRQLCADVFYADSFDALTDPDGDYMATVTRSS